MAAKGAWGNTSSWADSVEEDVAAGHHNPDAPAHTADDDDFPSLGAAAVTKAKPAKKKVVKMSLAEFSGGAAGKPAVAADILASLPKSSRGKVDGEEPAGRGLGGGFSFGGDRGDRRERPDRMQRDDFVPSRADEVSDWGSMRKFEPSDNRGPRGGGFRDGPGGGPREDRPVSDADMVDDWGTAKKFVPSEDRGGRDGPRRGPMFDRGPSRADEEDSWGRGREFQPSNSGPRGTSGGRPDRGPAGPAGPADTEDRWGKRSLPSAEDKPAPAANGAGQRPRLNLAPRTAPVEGAEAADAKPKSNNPFGAARPREEVLREQGKDPVKETLKLEHEETKRERTEAELALEAEVKALSEKLQQLKTEDASEEDKEEADKVAKELDEKELALLKLKVQLDDEIKYKRKGAERERERSDEPTWGRKPQSPAQPAAASAGGNPWGGRKPAAASGAAEEGTWGRKAQPQAQAPATAAADAEGAAAPAEPAAAEEDDGAWKRVGTERAGGRGAGEMKSPGGGRGGRGGRGDRGERGERNQAPAGAGSRGGKW